MAEDERYIEMDGRRWRRSDPGIPEALRAELVSELMSARRAVKSAKDDGDHKALAAARGRVQDAKVALGERGRPWWKQPDEESLRTRLAAAMRSLLRKREAGKTICPSDAARIAGGDHWRGAMDCAREVAGRLAEDGWLEVLKEGKPVDAAQRGPIRLRRRS